MAKGTTIRMWRRTAFLLAILIIGFAVVVGSLFRLQLVQGEEMHVEQLDVEEGRLVEVAGTPYEVQIAHRLDRYKNEFEIVRKADL